MDVGNVLIYIYIVPFVPKVALYFNLATGAPGLVNGNNQYNVNLVTGAPGMVNGNNQYPVNNIVERENSINPKFNGNNQYPVNNAVERENPINPEFVGNVKGNYESFCSSNGQKIILH